MKKRPAQIESVELPTPPDGYRFNFKVIPLIHAPVVTLEKKGWLWWKEVDALRLNPLPDEPLTRAHAVSAARQLLKRYNRSLQYDSEVSKLYSELHKD